MKIDSLEKLRSVYKMPSERAVQKDIGRIDKHARHIVGLSPFCVISTFDKKGKIDVSPRGGNPGFVKVVDEYTLVIPDSRGNNRLDNLTNIIETSRIGLLFLIPGIDETLRINGEASISTNDEWMKLFGEDEFKCVSVLLVKVEELFMHCAKAFMRSKLWDSRAQIDSTNFPSMGDILKDHLNLDAPAETRAEAKRRYLPEL